MPCLLNDKLSLWAARSVDWSAVRQNGGTKGAASSRYAVWQNRVTRYTACASFSARSAAASASMTVPS